MRRGLAVAVLAVLVVASATAVSGRSAGRRATPQLLAVTYPGGELRIVDVEGHIRADLVGPGYGTYDPAWSPNGRRIAFVRRVGKRHARFAVFVVDAAGGRTRRLTRGFRGIGVLTWSPDGARLAFVGQTSREVEAVLELRGPRLTQLTQAFVGAEPMQLAWLPHDALASCDEACLFHGPWLSPSGALRVAVRGDSAGNGQLVLEDRAGRREWLTRDRPVDREVHFNHCCAAWSSDGSKVFFLSDMNDRSTRDLFVIDSNGTNERRLTWNQDIETPLGVSGDGSYVAFHARGAIDVISLRDGRRHRVAEGWGDFAWRPVRGVQVREPVLASLRGLPLRHVRVDRRWYGPQPGRLEDVHVLTTHDPGAEAISPDGRFLVFVRYGTWASHSYRIGLFDLRSGRRRMLPGRYLVDRRDWWESNEEEVAGFSPDSRRLLVRTARTLVVVDLRTGARHLVARGFYWGPAGWLKDGRVAYIDGWHRLVIGERLTRFRAPKLTYSDPTWSPDGRTVLYAQGCAVWMLDLRTGARRKVAGPTRGSGAISGYSPGPWSPDGRYFLLRTGSWSEHCTYFEGDHADWSVRRADGRRVGRFEAGGGAAWSADSRTVLGFPYVSGTDVGKLFPLAIYDLRTGKAATLLSDRFEYPAFIVAGGRLIYGRYLSMSDRDGREYLYVAQLSPRWR